jgi:hypothetical protein
MKYLPSVLRIGVDVLDLRAIYRRNRAAEACRANNRGDEILDWMAGLDPDMDVRGEFAAASEGSPPATHVREQCPTWITAMRARGYVIREATTDVLPEPDATFSAVARPRLIRRLFALFGRRHRR